MCLLKDLLKEIVETDFDKLSFSDALRSCRDKIGLMQYRAAEHMHMTLGRLKNLETGYFRTMPREDEIEEICKLYNFPKEKLIEKAKEHVAERKRRLEIRKYKDKIDLR